MAKLYGLGKKDAALQVVSEFSISFDNDKGRKPPPKCKRKLSPEQRLERVEDNLEKPLGERSFIGNLTDGGMEQVNKKSS